VKFERVKYCNTTPVGYKRLVNAVNTKKLPNKICVPDDSLYKTAYTNGYISSDDATYVVPYPTYLQIATSEQFCDNNKKFVPSGCELKWEKQGDDDDTSKKCYVKGDDCVIYNNMVMKKDEADKLSGRNKSEKKNENLGATDIYQQQVAKYGELGYKVNNTYNDFEECDDAGGVFVAGQYNRCFCNTSWTNDNKCNWK
jgi:hypothetical protein